MKIRLIGLKHILIIIIMLSFFNGISQSKKAERFIDNYADAAFWKVSGKNQPLVKWYRDTLVYQVAGDMRYISEKEWNEFLSEVSSLTGKTFVSAEDGKYEILIFFGSFDAYAARTGSPIPQKARQQFNNWSSRNWDKDFRLTRASLCIVPSMVSEEYQGKYHLKKSFLKSLGILGETEDQYSLLYRYPSSSNTKLLREDKRIIKMHYNNIIESGMNAPEVKSALRGLKDIEDLAREKL